MSTQWFTINQNVVYKRIIKCINAVELRHILKCVKLNVNGRIKPVMYA